jgi:hypothetical protein
VIRKPISEKVLPVTLSLIDKHEQQLKLMREMIRGVEYRIGNLKDFVRANVTGDKEAFKAIAAVVTKNVGNSRRYYDNDRVDTLTTDRIVTNERQKNEKRIAEVSALREASATDQVQEVPAAPSDAGAHLPDVESEGGHPD